MLRITNSNSRLPSSPSENEPLQQLNNTHTSEVLSFLSARPLHTFVKTSWISDNGLVSPMNRGTFYGYRDSAGKLQGVALIGHITLFESQAESALAAFAALAQTCTAIKVVLSEANKFHRFMKHYANERERPRRLTRELLLQKQTAASLDSLTDLRRAHPEELDLVLPIHAQAAFEESGVNPLELDADGFRKRCARRLKQGRVWIVSEEGRIRFKADVVSQTPEVVYLEGIYVSPDHRGSSYGARCLIQLTNQLLARAKSVCLLVDENNSAARTSYSKAGFQFREYYNALFLKSQSSCLPGEAA